MTKHGETTVRIAEFKARLSHYLRGVRRGNPLTLLDRDTPVARVLPLPGDAGRLRIRRPSRRPGSVRLPRPVRKRTDSLAALRKERDDRR